MSSLLSREPGSVTADEVLEKLTEVVEKKGRDYTQSDCVYTMHEYDSEDDTPEIRCVCIIAHLMHAWGVPLATMDHWTGSVSGVVNALVEEEKYGRANTYRSIFTDEASQKIWRTFTLEALELMAEVQGYADSGKVFENAPIHSWYWDLAKWGEALDHGIAWLKREREMASA